MTLPVPPVPPTQVGLPVDKGQVDQTSGMLARTIEQWSSQVLNFQEYLTSVPDATLEAPPFNYSADNVATLKSAFTDLALLANIYKGQADITPARDLSTFAKRLAGIVL